ncbi:MAG: hypothetical protein JWN35_3012 [Frankiales bacterium]|nr:hypothetical protein [Frankiales bacterium]
MLALPNSRLLLLLPAGLLAVAAPTAGLVSSGAGDITSYVVRTGTVLAALGLLLRRARRGPSGVARACRLIVLGLLVSVVSGVLAVAQSAGWSSLPVGFDDALYLAHVPFIAAGLLSVPLLRSGPGGRLRAVADGAVAAASLGSVVNLLVFVPHVSDGGPRQLLASLNSLADVFLLAVALSLLPRVVPVLRRFVALTSAGLVLLSVRDVLYALAVVQEPVGRVGVHGTRAVLSELGLLLIVAGAASAGGLAGAAARARWVALLPYLPIALSLGVYAVLTFGGREFGRVDVLLGLLVGLAMGCRQAIATWDAGRLLDELALREQRYRAQALEDPLTGLPNRRAFTEAVERALTAGRLATVMFADCDEFKAINDTHGHLGGDRVLCHVGTQMRLALGGKGTVARLGGDEFGVLVWGDAQTAIEVAQQLRVAAAQPLDLGRREYRTRVSIGAATTRANDDVSALLSHADVALYRAKAGRGDGVVVLDPEGRREAADYLRLRDDVADPELTQFHVDYQPLFAIGTGTLIGAEALLRWNHPVLGPVPPATFIPLAEQTGGIESLGDFVLETALRQLSAWTEAHPQAPLVMCVNVSPRQFVAGGDLADRILGLLTRHRLRPWQLAVEVTEQSAIADLEPIAAVALVLRTAGVSVAVDDFGTGYSSLRHLERIPSDILKIDRSFTSTVCDSPEARALVRGIIALARELGLRTVAEGVETAEQLDVLRELGCHEAQGFLLGRPGEPDAIQALLDEAAEPPVGRSMALPRQGRSDHEHLV